MWPDLSATLVRTVCSPPAAASDEALSPADVHAAVQPPERNTAAAVERKSDDWQEVDAGTCEGRPLGLGSGGGHGAGVAWQSAPGEAAGRTHARTHACTPRTHMRTPRIASHAPHRTTPARHAPTCASMPPCAHARMHATPRRRWGLASKGRIWRLSAISGIRKGGSKNSQSW